MHICIYINIHVYMYFVYTYIYVCMCVYTYTDFLRLSWDFAHVRGQFCEFLLLD